MRTISLILLGFSCQFVNAQSDNSVILRDKVSTGFTDHKTIDQLPDLIVIIVSNKDFSGESVQFSDTSGKKF